MAGRDQSSHAGGLSLENTTGAKRGDLRGDLRGVEDGKGVGIVNNELNGQRNNQRTDSGVSRVGVLYPPPRRVAAADGVLQAPRRAGVLYFGRKVRKALLKVPLKCDRLRQRMKALLGCGRIASNGSHGRGVERIC